MIVKVPMSKGARQLLELGCKVPGSAREGSSFLVLADVVLLKDFDKQRTTLFPDLCKSRTTCPRDK